MPVRSRPIRAASVLATVLVATGGVAAVASPLNPTAPAADSSGTQTAPGNSSPPLLREDSSLSVAVGDAKRSHALSQVAMIHSVRVAARYQAKHLLDVTKSVAREKAAAAQAKARTLAQAKAAQQRADEALALSRAQAVQKAESARKAAQERATRSSARQSAGTWPGQGVDWVESFRRCIVKRESEGQYGVVDPTGTWFGAYQFALGTSNEAARRMGRSDLIGTPANRWNRAAQDGAFYVIFANGAGRSHWAGGRYAC